MHPKPSADTSQREKGIVLECFKKIDFEMQQAIDKHSRKLIMSDIERLLNYCVRFYDRQFITREVANTGILESFEQQVHDYFQTGQALEKGVPSVAHFAEQLHLSANYFGDLIRKEPGKSAQEYIHAKLIEVAREKMFAPLSWKDPAKYRTFSTRMQRFLKQSGTKANLGKSKRRFQIRPFFKAWNG